MSSSRRVGGAREDREVDQAAFEHWNVARRSHQKPYRVRFIVGREETAEQRSAQRTSRSCQIGQRPGQTASLAVPWPLTCWAFTASQKDDASFTARGT